MSDPREPMTHELKTWPEPFEAVWSGKKTHEVRLDDRDFRVGDQLRLRSYDPGGDGAYLGGELTVLVTHITRAPFVPPGLCVMSIRLEINDVGMRSPDQHRTCVDFRCGECRRAAATREYAAEEIEA